MKVYVSKTHLYKIYYGMKKRCYNKNDPNYKKYGARGIVMSDEWLGEKGRENFFEWASNNGYYYEKLPNGRSKLTIDRIDNDKGYSPENCRWVTNKEQLNNTRVNVKLEYKGKKYTIAELSELLNINYQTIHKRLKYYNYDIDKVLTAPLHIRLDYETKSGERYIYKIKDSYSVQIKKKYYGCRKSLEDAIKLRNEKLKELQIQGEDK